MSPDGTSYIQKYTTKHSNCWQQVKPSLSISTDEHTFLNTVQCIRLVLTQYFNFRHADIFPYCTGRYATFISSVYWYMAAKGWINQHSLQGLNYSRRRCQIPKFKKKTRIEEWYCDSRRVQIRTTTSLWTSPHYLKTSTSRMLKWKF